MDMRRDDPFDDFFEELERMMNDVMGGDSLRVDDAARSTGEVHVDVQEADEHLHVIADVPGVDKEAIDLLCDGAVLTIDASSDRRDYYESVDLPARVDEHSADASYNNGILEVVFDREEDPRDISLS